MRFIDLQLFALNSYVHERCLGEVPSATWIWLVVDASCRPSTNHSNDEHPSHPVARNVIFLKGSTTAKWPWASTQGYRPGVGPKFWARKSTDNHSLTHIPFANGVPYASFPKTAIPNVLDEVCLANSSNDFWPKTVPKTE